MPFVVHTVASAPTTSRPLLEAAQRTFGMVSNAERVMAGSPELLEGFGAIETLFARTSLTAIEQQVVMQAANVENRCTYCVPWHTTMCRQAGMSEPDVLALRDGSPLSTPKLEALRAFTRALVRGRGLGCVAEQQDFFAAGFTERQALDIVLGIAMKVITNYTNAIADTPLEAIMRGQAWQPPAV